VREAPYLGGRVLTTWWSDNNWTGSECIPVDISYPAVHVEVVFVKGDGTEILLDILNHAPDTSYGWLVRNQCHALEVSWPIQP
jgi:stringent starvation protein B